MRRLPRLLRQVASIDVLGLWPGMEEQMDIQQHMNSLNNDELLAATKEAYKDLQRAAEEAPESERHQECFAGFYCYAQECQRRGLKTVTIH